MQDILCSKTVLTVLLICTEKYCFGHRKIDQRDTVFPVIKGNILRESSFLYLFAIGRGLLVM